jgi:diguanylate cyclase (GGDEF)-like protein
VASEDGFSLRRSAPSSACADPFASAATSSPAPDAAAILASVGTAVYEWRLDTDALSWSANASAVLGIADVATFATGRSFAQYLDPANKTTRYDAVMQSAARDDGDGVPYQLQYALRCGDRQLWVEDIGRWFGGMDGRPRFAHGVVRVITERHEREQRLSYLSKFDGLTGEVNRWHLTELLDECIESAARTGRGGAFLLVGIDNLARINQAYGYAVADELIAAIAKRMRAILRTTDALGRFSGNKFGIVLKDCTLEEMNIAADRLRACVRDEIVHAGPAQVAMTITIAGIALPRHARDVQEAVARAQETLDLAKVHPGCFRTYRPSVEREALRRENLRATDEIVAALNDRGILLAFEPVVHINTRQTAFFEALMRVRRADGGIEVAASIIPVAERLGLVRLLDNRVLELVVGELVQNPSLCLSLNVSPASTVHADWWDYLAAQLRSHHGLGERLTVEITEMAEIRDVEETRGFVRRIKDLGCRIAIDDFGAGYTSLRNLRRLGVDILKIDGAYVQNLTRSEDDQIFVRTILDLARSLGLASVAEWVKCEETVAMLRAWGCDYLQGELVGMASFERPDMPGHVALAKATSL